MVLNVLSRFPASLRLESPEPRQTPARHPRPTAEVCPRGHAILAEGADGSLGFGGPGAGT
jgi:hypothetical protein